MKRKAALGTGILAMILCLAMGFTAYAQGWEQDGNGWWYSTDSGYLSNGFSQIDGKWYYFGGDGYMCTGWVQDGGKWYYMDGSGVMLANTTTPDGKYWLDANGVWDGKTIGSSNAASSLERNTMKATIDGVEETFYLTSTGGTAGGYKYYSAYALKADGTLGKKLSININPDVSSGTTAKKGDKIKGFSLSYKTSPGGFQYSARPGKGDYTVTITSNESNGSHVEGTFSATARMIDGNGKVSITGGSFNVYFGEQVASVAALVDANSAGGGSYAGSDGYDTGSSDVLGSGFSNDYTCRSCNGDGRCKSCAGRGYKRRNGDGKEVDCLSCRGSGTCPICNGFGKVY